MESNESYDLTEEKQTLTTGKIIGKKEKERRDSKRRAKSTREKKGEKGGS